MIIGASTGALAAVDGMVAREVLTGDDFATLLSLLGFVGTLGGAFGPVLVGLLVQRTGSLGVVPVVVVVGSLVSVAVQVGAGRVRPVENSV